MKRESAVILLCLSALCWSLGGVLIKWVAWHPLAISGVRSLIASFLLLAVFGRPRFTWSVPQVGGALAYAATAVLFVVATKLTTAANAIFLQYTAPAFVAVFGIGYLGERPSGRDWIALGTVMAGMVLFFFDHLTLTGVWGNITALCSGVTFAWMALFTRRQKDTSPVESVLLGNLLAFLIGLPFMFGEMPHGTGWLCLIALGVVQLGAAYVFFPRRSGMSPPWNRSSSRPSSPCSTRYGPSFSSAKSLVPFPFAGEPLSSAPYWHAACCRCCPRGRQGGSFLPIRTSFPSPRAGIQFQHRVYH